MKNLALLLLCLGNCLLSFQLLYSQSMIDTSHVWIVKECGVDITNPGPVSCITNAYILRNPVVVNGKTYYQLYKGGLLDEETNQYSFFHYTWDLYRSEGKKVYHLVPASPYPESLIYDFSLEDNDVFEGAYSVEIAAVWNNPMTNGEFRNVFFIREDALFPDYEVMWVDGIGGNFFTFNPVLAYSPNDVWEVFDCFYVNGGLVTPWTPEPTECPDSVLVVEPVLVNTNTVKPNNIKVYPNPSNGWLSIEIPTTKQQVFELRLFDLQGRLMWLKTYEIITEKLTINHLEPGFYNLQIVGEDWTNVKKIVVK